MTEEIIIKTLIAEIKFEMTKILPLKDDMNLLTKSFGNEGPDKFYCSAAGYLLHNFYSGAENIFKKIAAVFGNQIEKSEWHSALLKRMVVEIEDLRPSVITEQLYKELIDFKNFRHFFRHAYLFELDWDKMKPLVHQFEKTIDAFDAEIKVFLKKIKDSLKP